MKYKGFLIQKEYAGDIFRPCDNVFRHKLCKDDFEARGGYRCRIYADDDNHLTKILAVIEFAYDDEITYDERDDIADRIMSFIDDNEGYLIQLKELSKIAMPVIKGLVYSIDNNILRRE